MRAKAHKKCTAWLVKQPTPVALDTTSSIDQACYIDPQPSTSSTRPICGQKEETFLGGKVILTKVKLQRQALKTIRRGTREIVREKTLSKGELDKRLRNICSLQGHLEIVEQYYRQLKERKSRGIEKLTEKEIDNIISDLNKFTIIETTSESD